MKELRTLTWLLLFLLVAGCRKSVIIRPPQADESNLVATQRLTDTVMRSMEGIYKLAGGSDILGQQFVCKVSKYRVSFFSNKEGIFIILKYGLRVSDSSIQFSGFWRYTETNEQGTVQFSITKANGAADLLAGIVTNLAITGVNPGNDIKLQYDRAFSAAAINKNFMIIGHHGVQTTVDPPYPENSLLGVLHDEDYGVNGLEFDIRLTRDNVPICIHDPAVTPRLTVKGPISGKWDKYTFGTISNYVSLIDGQKVPSLEQVLTAFIDSTNLRYFWMDIKGNDNVFKYLEPIVRNAYSRAAAKKRNVVIFAGMPSDDVIKEFKEQPSFADLPTLCEQSVDLAIENKSKYFGPRFSQGLLLDDVAKAHANGIRVISWTLNDDTLIRNYIQNGQFDGFITDYPAYVVYDIYTRY